MKGQDEVVLIDGDVSDGGRPGETTVCLLRTQLIRLLPTLQVRTTGDRGIV